MTKFNNLANFAHPTLDAFIFPSRTHLNLTDISLRQISAFHLTYLSIFTMSKINFAEQRF